MIDVSPRQTITERYRFEQIVGRGGMGTVWQATDLLLGRTVAIKDMLLPPQTRPDERHSARTRVMREAHAAARVSDPAVVTVHDVVEEQDRLFLVMEFVAAPSLEDKVLRDGPLPPNEVAALGARLAGALTRAHQLGVIHRDVKPSNVLLPNGGSSAKLVDFGIAAIADTPGVTSAGFVMGSPSYMSPEQAEGRPASEASDVFSLGAALFFAVEGDGPFQRGNTMATLAAVASQPPRSPERAGPVAPLVLAMMAKDPAARPTMTEAGAALSALSALPAAAQESPILTSAGGPDGTRLVPSLQDRPAPAAPGATRGRGRVMLTGLVVVLLTALMVIGVMVISGGGDSPPPVDPPVTTAPPVAETTAPPAETTVPGAEAPPGFFEYADPQGGFTILQPDGFDVTVDEADHVTEITSGGTRIAVRWFDPAVDPIAFLESERDRLSAFPRYEELAFDDETFLDAPGGFWEFEFAENGGNILMHSTGRAFTIGDGDDRVTYAVFFRAPADEFDRLEAEVFAVVEDSFRPA